MSKKKHAKSTRQTAAPSDSCGEDILAALERAGAPLTRKELVAGRAGNARARVGLERRRARAAVRVSGQDPRGRPAGTIVEVLSRSNRRIVGRLHREHGVLFLVPE